MNGYGKLFAVALGGAMLAVSAANQSERYLMGPTITEAGSDDYTLRIDQTLNDGSAASGTQEWRGLSIDYTRTAHAGWDNLYPLEIRRDGSSRMQLTDDGNLSISAEMRPSNLRVSSSGIMYWATLTELRADADGTLEICNAAESECITIDTRVTSDPCGTLQEGSLFYNDTADVYCYCDGGGDDLKVHDNSACF